MSGIKFTQVATPSNPAANLCQLYYNSATAKLTVVDQNGNLVVVGGFATKDYRLVRVTSITQGTTSFAPTSNSLAGYVEGLGAGAGGGGAATGATNAAAAGGGGSGGYSAAWLTGAAWTVAGFTCQVGAGGAGGTAGANNGSVGTDTTFTDNGSTLRLTAKGGTGGISSTVAAGPVIGGLGSAGGASASGTGDNKIDGNPGGTGIMLAAAQALSGYGGIAPMFGGGAGVGKNAQSAGSNATNYGGGGSGGCILSGGASVAGGNGGNGLIRIWEFA